MFKKIFLTTALLVLVNVAFAAKIGDLPQLAKPESLLVDKDRVFITEGASVYIYSLKDVKLIKKFGKMGAGPGEFKVRGELGISIHNDQLLVNSMSKLSVYSIDGELVKETNTKFPVTKFQGLDKHFVGNAYTRKEKKLCYALNTFSPELERLKEFYWVESSFQPNKKYNPISTRTIIFHVYKNKIVADGGGDMKNVLYVFDETGKELYKIDHDFEKLPFTKKDESAYLEYFKTNPAVKRTYERTKQFISFPEYFPVTWDFRTADDKIYVLTYKRVKEKSEFYIFDIADGKFVKKVLLPLEKLTVDYPYPFSIRDNTLYQIVEDEEENWELHAVKID